MFASQPSPTPTASDLFLAFAEPLIEGDDEESLDRALGLAMLFWTLAQVTEPVEREAAIATLADAKGGDSELERRRFCRLAQRMVLRARTMLRAV